MRYKLTVWLKDIHRVEFSIHENKLEEFLLFCEHMNYKVTNIQDVKQ